MQTRWSSNCDEYFKKVLTTQWPQSVPQHSASNILGLQSIDTSKVHSYHSRRFVDGARKISSVMVIIMTLPKMVMLMLEIESCVVDAARWLVFFPFKKGVCKLTTLNTMLLSFGRSNILFRSSNSSKIF